MFYAVTKRLYNVLCPSISAIKFYQTRSFNELHHRKRKNSFNIQKNTVGIRNTLYMERRIRLLTRYETTTPTTTWDNFHSRQQDTFALQTISQQGCLFWRVCLFFLFFYNTFEICETSFQLPENFLLTLEYWSVLDKH